jgi:hypothetical protein
MLIGVTLLFISCDIGNALNLHSLNVAVAANAIVTVNNCEGEACNQIVLTWDESRGSFRVQNNSTTRWARVEAANLVTSATICIGPGRTDYLSIKSIVGNFKATFSEENCGRGA